MNRRNITIVDELLIGAGGVGLVLGLSLVYAEHGAGTWLRGWSSYLALSLALGSALLLALGLIVRHRERTTLRLWTLLRHSPDTHLGTLLAQSRFTLADIRRGVRDLNDSGIGHYVLDEPGDRLFDGRLNAMVTLRQQCAGCGASTEATVDMQLAKDAACTYCDMPFEVASINALRQERRQSLERENASSAPVQLAGELPLRPPARAPAFSMVTFVILLALFWPGAFFYAARYLLSLRRHEERLQSLLGAHGAGQPGFGERLAG